MTIRSAGNRFLLLLYILALTGCAGGVSETGNPSRSYVTSSTEGFGTWNVSDQSFSAEWSVTAPSTGVVQYTYSLGGSCGAPTTYGFKPCSLYLIQCRDGASSCTNLPVASDIFYVLEIPGVAVMVYAPTRNELHSGVLRGDCTTDIAGDYTSMQSALGSVNLFGMFRADSAFSALIHSDFALAIPATPTLVYTTLDGGGTGLAALSNVSCTDGIRDFTMSGLPIRATMMQGGLWSFSYPYGLGGAIAFRKELAARLSDIAGKTLYGFVTADDAATAMARLELGALSAGRVPYQSLSYSTGLAPSVAGQYITSVTDVGATFGFNGNPPGLGAGVTYATSLLQPGYATPGDVPGLFLNPAGASASDGMIVTIMKSNGKVLLLGLRFGDRAGTIKATGSVMLFEQ